MGEGGRQEGPRVRGQAGGAEEEGGRQEGPRVRGTGRRGRDHFICTLLDCLWDGFTALLSYTTLGGRGRGGEYVMDCKSEGGGGGGGMPPVYGYGVVSTVFYF